MEEKEIREDILASTEQLEKELARVDHKNSFHRALRRTVYALVVAAAVSVLVASLFLPVLRIYGSSMVPTVEAGDIVVSLKKREYLPGDVVALYYENRILVKRIVAGEFDTVELDADGNFRINGTPLDEPYLAAKDFGDNTDISFPFQVPEDSYFVCGDNRKESVDSRSSSVGCISSEEIVGEIVFSVWPWRRIGKIH